MQKNHQRKSKRNNPSIPFYPIEASNHVATQPIYWNTTIRYMFVHLLLLYDYIICNAQGYMKDTRVTVEHFISKDKYLIQNNNWSMYNNNNNNVKLSTFYILISQVSCLLNRKSCHLIKLYITYMIIHVNPK